LGDSGLSFRRLARLSLFLTTSRLAEVHRAATAVIADVGYETATMTKMTSARC
jgi:hypothetical protein